MIPACKPAERPFQLIVINAVYKPYWNYFYYSEVSALSKPHLVNSEVCVYTKSDTWSAL
jgi:hypothetical protein